MGKRIFQSGFTIVELLIVVVIIGILAALVMVGYSTAQTKAKRAKAQHEVASLMRVMVAARANTGKPLHEITGQTYTVGPCIGLAVEPSTLNKNTHPCWLQYRAALQAIAAAAQVNLTSFYEGTSDGQPFYIDENEAEDEDEPCRQDVIIDRGKNFAQTQGDELSYQLPWSISGC